LEPINIGAIVLISGLLAAIVKRAITSPINNALLEPDEERLGELFVFNRDLRHKGYIPTSPNEGKLILTTTRLLYCWYDERKVTSSFTPSDISSLDLLNKREAFILKKPVIRMKLKNNKEVYWELLENPAGQNLNTLQL
jgi:hypothetical protein